MFPNNKKKKQFDKSDIHFCTGWVDYEIYTETIRDHTLMYVYTDELIVWEKSKKHGVNANECIFIKKGSSVSTSGSTKNEESFSATYIRLRKCFLKEFFKCLQNKTGRIEIIRQYVKNTLHSRYQKPVLFTCSLEITGWCIFVVEHARRFLFYTF